MCGVAANFAYHYAAPAVDRDELRTIRDQMRARGPDGAELAAVAEYVQRYGIANACRFLWNTNEFMFVD